MYVYVSIKVSVSAATQCLRRSAVEDGKDKIELDFSL